MRRVPLHPLMLATFPAISLYSRNAQHVGPGEVLVPLTLSVVAAALVLAASRALVGGWRGGAVVASGFILLFASYGHVWSSVREAELFGRVVGRDLVLLPVWILALVGIVALGSRLRGALADTTAVLNLVALGLVIVATAGAGTAYASRGNAAVMDEPGDAVLTARGTTGGRDVYYVVLDRYASARTLRDLYGFDNEPFLAELERRGFYVARDSFANYPKTAHSLSASMGMRYLGDVVREVGRDSADWKPLYDTLVDPPVAQAFRDLGYLYMHIGSWWDPTADDPTADQNFHYAALSEFDRALVEGTVLLAAGKRLGVLGDRFDPRRVHAKQVLFQFDTLDRIGEDPRTTFTFAHILLPHAPFVFRSDGSFLPEDVMNARERNENYLDHLRFANVKVLALLDRLLDVPEADRPIVVLQSDEGPHPGRLVEDEEGFAWRDATDEELRMKFRILNAIHMPQGQMNGLYPSISPVNTFRFVLSHGFGLDLPPLRDRAFIYGDNAHPYEFREVTRTVR